MLRNIHPTLLKFLVDIYNHILKTGIYPTTWKNAIILAFLKPKKPTTEAASYRPIALTSCAGKLLEKILNLRLANWLEKENIYSEFQFGFRQQRSTIDSLTRLSNDIYDTFEKKKKMICYFLTLKNRMTIPGDMGS